MRPFDHEIDGVDPWNWDGDFDGSWQWPSFPAFPDTLREPCAFGCEYGAVRFGESFWCECPVCAGSGVGGEHNC